MSDAETDQRMQSIASEMGIALYRRYSENKTAELIGIHPQTLKQKRLAGGIAYVRLGSRTIQYFGFQIIDFLLGSIEWQNQTTRSIGSQSIGSAKGQARTSSTVTGGTASADAQDALLLAQQALKKPSQN